MKYFSIFTGNTLAKKALSIVLLFSYVVVPLTPIMPVAQVYAATSVAIPDLATVQSIFNNGEVGGTGIDFRMIQGLGSVGFNNDQATKDRVCQIAGYTANTDGVATVSNWNSCNDETIISWNGSSWVYSSCQDVGNETSYVSELSCGAVTDVVDVCPNIAGAQATVPAGYTVDGSGNCIVTVVNNAPIASLSVSPSTVAPGGSVTITGSYADSDANLFKATIRDLGTGNKDGDMGVFPAIGTAGEEISGSSATLNRNFTIPAGTPSGTYWFRTEVSDTATGLDVAWTSASVTVSNGAPTAPTITGPVTGTVNTSYTFTFNSTDPDGDDVSYGVDWDNNGTVEPADSTAEFASGVSGSLAHSWNTVGSKTFTVYTRDANGAQSTGSTHTIVIGSAPVVNPTGTFTASTSSVPRGDTVTLDWNVQNADLGCNATGGWAGNKSTASSEVTGPINADTTYNLTCSNSTEGSRTFSVTVTVFDPNYNPVISSLTASPSSITLGGYSMLTWSTANATSCSASSIPSHSSWTGVKGLSGTDRVEPINATTTFTLTCLGATGLSTSSSVVVSVGNGTTSGTTTYAVLVDTPADPSTTELGSSVVYGIQLASRPLADVTMTVNSSDYTEGTTSVRTITFEPDNWNVVRSVVVTGVDDVLSDGNVSYSLMLGATQSSDINYNNLSAQNFAITNIDNEAPVNPVSFVSFTANPGSVTAGGSATLSWIATGTISSCAASGAWSGAKSATGTEVVGPIAATSTYTIVCTGLGGTATSSVIIGINNGGGSVNTAPTAPTITGPVTGTVNTSYTFTFNSTDPDGDDVSYGVDWDNNGTVEPADSTAEFASGVSGSLAHSWNTVGSKTFTVYTRDANGAQSTGSTHTIVIGDPTVSFLSFTASPLTVVTGGTSTLSWIATGTISSCAASGAWSGAKSATGTEVVGPIAATSTYTIVCTSTDGTSATSSLTITVNDGGNNNGTSTVSILSFTATPGTVSNGGSATLAWTATGTVASCAASGGWSGAKSATGTEVVGPISTATNYTITCTSTDGTTASSTVTVTIGGGGDNGTSTVSFLLFTASPLTVAVGGTSTLSWIATGTIATCTASGAWSGVKSATGTEVVGPLATTTSFTMVCTSTDGTSATSSLTITVNGGNNNGTSTVSILSFTATPSTISKGGSATLAWTATGTVASCAASGGWSGAKSATGTEGVGPLSATTNYTLVCTSTDGTSATSTVTVTVNGGGSSGGGGGSSSGGRRHCVPGINIPGLDCPAEESTTTPALLMGDQAPVTRSGVCTYADFITTYMKKDADNNPDEVTKLQYFLNEYEGASLELSGIFDDATENAVKDFQAKYTADILEPWGTTTPTGIVYITTTLKINTIFCSANPGYDGTIEIKDKTITNVLDTATTTPEFDGAIGAATTTFLGFDNIAGIFGAMTAKLIQFLKDIPWYLFLISLLAITGSVVALGKELKTKFKKEEAKAIKDISLKTKNGLYMVAIATVLNVLNTLSFIADWKAFNTLAGIDANALPIALLVNMLAILLGFVAIYTYVSYRKE